MKTQIFFLFCFLISNAIFSQSKTLHVGTGQQYPNIQTAAQYTKPGDKIMVHNGTFTNRENISNLNGEPEKPIIIFAEEEGNVIYSGQSEAWHLSSCSHLFIYGFTFEKQTANGVNIDDSGNFDGSANNITIKNCIFRDMNANGNNDQLKLSGLDDFIIEKCRFINGSSGGSGTDMVGCHNGKIENNHFENMGSNSIQMKGGSQYISVFRNKFINGGQRSINIGGSTGLDYFRPKDAKFESADIDVYSNVFIGSWAPIAFVGTIRSRVFNNTFYKPQNWVFRILQETVDPDRFYPCGQNEFTNNIVYFGNSLSRIVNVGPNTDPGSFTFSNNLWYNYENNNFSNPDLPVQETNPIIQSNPKFADAEKMNFEILDDSPALNSGKKFSDVLDYNLRYFNELPCIGAFQSNGIYKDFTGEVSTEWVYDYKGKTGHQSLIIHDKVNEDDKEISLIKYSESDSDNSFIKYKFFTTDDKFYYKQTDQDGQDYQNDTFHLLYDYTLKKGDQVLINDPYNYFTKGCGVYIDTVRFENIAGKVRKIQAGFSFTLEFISFDTTLNCGQSGKLIEGIHSVNSYMFGNPTIINGNGSVDDSNALNVLRCFRYSDDNGEIETKQFTDYDCYSTVNTFFPEIDNLILYPNPVRDELNISFDSDFTGQIEIIDLTGKSLVNKSLYSQRIFTIDVDHLKNGIYVVRIFKKDIWFQRKIVIINCQ